MEWLYYIPHRWDKPTDRTVWEDVYLMPALGWEDKREKMSIWLEVDALRKKPAEENFDEMKEYIDALKKLKDQDYVIDSDICIMIVRTEDFDMEELLEYAKVFIKDVFHDEDIVLVKGTYEDFVGTNAHAGTLEGLGTILEQEYGDAEDKDGEENDD